MNEQPNNFVRKTNRLAIISLVAGIVSFLLVIYMFFVIATGSGDTPITFYIFGGFLFAAICEVTGKRALEQIKKSGNIEKGRGLVITGKVIIVLPIILIILLFVKAIFTN